MTAIAGVVGNPKPQSRTLTVARQALTTLEKALVSHGHGVEDQGIVDLAELGAELITGGPGVDAAIATVVGADVLVVASPTYKATYTGLLKLFLDRLPPRALAGHTALPLMVTGSPVHALAVEVHLRPLLVELGATVPTPGLALTEADLADPAPRLHAWLDQAAFPLVFRSQPVEASA